MKPKRKLLTKLGYTKLKEEVDRGVPMRRALLNLGLNLSLPTAYQLIQFSTLEHPNLYPVWLDQDGPMLQECPPEWRFKGFFPITGEWLCSKP